MAIQTLTTDLKGDTGDTGTRGSTWSSTAGAPSVTSGRINGDQNLDITNVDIYELQTGNWVKTTDLNAKNIQSTAYASGTGIVTFTFQDTTSFATGDLRGADGVSPAFDSNVVVTTIAVGGSATASITGTDSVPILNVGIPTGATGATGTIGSASIDALNDVDTTTATPEDGDTLVWATDEWIPGTPASGPTLYQSEAVTTPATAATLNFSLATSTDPINAERNEITVVTAEIMQFLFTISNAVPTVASGVIGWESGSTVEEGSPGLRSNGQLWLPGDDTSTLAGRGLNAYLDSIAANYNAISTTTPTVITNLGAGATSLSLVRLCTAARVGTSVVWTSLTPGLTSLTWVPADSTFERRNDAQVNPATQTTVTNGVAAFDTTLPVVGNTYAQGAIVFYPATSPVGYMQLADSSITTTADADEFPGTLSTWVDFTS